MTGRCVRAATLLCWAGAAMLTVRGIGGSVGVARSLAWLDARRPVPDAALSGGGPRFAVVLPMLREQALIADALTPFEKIATARPGTVLVVVTTAREDAERETARGRLGELSQALAAGLSPGRLAARFAGVLPRDRLAVLAAQAVRGDLAACRAAVERAFAAVPATAADLTVQATGRGADVRHLHYPDADGAMADQVNYAARSVLDRLETGERARWWIGL